MNWGKANVPGHGWKTVWVESEVYWNSSSSKVVHVAGVATDGSPMPAGWLGVNMAGYRSGGLCGFTWADYSTSQGNDFSKEYNLCTDPAGTQDFVTTAKGYLWNGNDYTDKGWQSSPSLNH